MRAGSRVWSRCMLNGDVYRRQIGPLMRGRESQSSSSLWMSAVRPVPYGEGQKWGSNVVETKTLIHLSNSFFLCVFLHSTLFPLFWFLSAVRKWLTFKIASRDIFIDRLWQVSLRIFLWLCFLISQSVCFVAEAGTFSPERNRRWRVLTAVQAGGWKGWQSRACLTRLLVVDSLLDQTLGERSENQARRRQAVRAGSVGWSATSKLVYPINLHWGKGIVPPCCRESHRWTLEHLDADINTHCKPHTWTADKCKQSVHPAPLLADVMYINPDCFTQTGTQSHTKTNYDLYTLKTCLFLKMVIIKWSIKIFNIINLLKSNQVKFEKFYFIFWQIKYCRGLLFKLKHGQNCVIVWYFLKKLKVEKYILLYNSNIFPFKISSS